MTKEEYLQWIQSGFSERNGGWYPDFNYWLDAVDRSHKDIRQFLGNDIVSKRYNLDACQKSIDINQEPTKTILDRILCLLPGVCVDNKITREQFAYPTASLGNHNALKLSRVVTRYARDCGHRGEVLTEIDKLVSQLGEIWAKARTNQCELGITISTTAKAFTLLGHYGPDNNSCFRQGSSSPYDKYILGQSLDTFIITVSQFNQKKNKEKNVARAFGWYANNSFYIRNYYFVEGFQEGDFIHVCEKLFSDLTKQTAKTTEGLGIFSNTSYNNWRFFENNYGNWCFHYNKPATSALNLNINNIVIFICPRCGCGYKNKNYWQTIDDEKVCPKCVESANYCTISGIYTFKPLHQLVSDNGDILEVHESVLHNYSQCKMCNRHTAVVMDTDSGEVCPECFAVHFSYCEHGHHDVIDEEIVDIGDIAVCKKHINDFMKTEEYQSLIEEMEIKNA